MEYFPQSAEPARRDERKCLGIYCSGQPDHPVRGYPASPAWGADELAETGEVYLMCSLRSLIVFAALTNCALRANCVRCAH